MFTYSPLDDLFISFPSTLFGSVHTEIQDKQKRTVYYGIFNGRNTSRSYFLW